MLKQKVKKIYILKLNYQDKNDWQKNRQLEETNSDIPLAMF